MSNKWSSAMISGVFLAALLLVGRAAAVAPEIKDEGKFFSADAIKKANKQIRDIAKKYGKDLLIETFPAVPGDQTARLKAMTAEERDKFFLNWAKDRADVAVVNGVYVLVCKDPAHLDVFITEKARDVFDKEAIDKLRGLLIKNFREKHFDEGLQAAADFVQEKLAAAAK